MLAEQGKLIRERPVAHTTYLLKKVSGLLLNSNVTLCFSLSILCVL